MRSGRIAEVGNRKSTFIAAARKATDGRPAAGGVPAGVLILCLTSVFTGVCTAADTTPLQRRLEPFLAAHKGKVAVAVKHLKTGESFTHREGEPMPTASLIKLAVMIEAYRQADEKRIDLDKPVTLKADDKVPGSGILATHFSPGTSMPLGDAIRLMIAYSDNTATNLVLEQIGLEATAKTMERLGCPNTKIHSKVFRRDTSVFPARSQQFGLGSTTAREMLRLLELLHKQEAASPAACTAMLAHLKNCQDKQTFRRLLPAGTVVAFKTGAVTAVRTAAGIIETASGPVALVVLTAENADRRWSDDNSGNLLCAYLARETFSYFAAPAAPAGERPALRKGDSGPEVEKLQRLLNAKARPSPQLAVDGEFGPQTEEALVAFQKQAGLAATGRATAETWEKLGALPDSQPAVPDPATINSARLAKAPADALDGPPFVTCKAWAIADGQTGALLWGHEADRPLDFASTTKIMTALLVCELAAREPAVLQETVVFSERADHTPGSTADVHAGEQAPVGELLYGLLLPSGNDAATALAEHFGPRLFSAGGNGQAAADAPADPLARFVAVMNRRAEQLQMQETKYHNPHGLTVAGHVASARDLAKLCFAARQNDLFRKYVAARQRGCTLLGPNGSRRNVVWKNTNNLLTVEGYDGIKTGTTNAAGACLTSSGKRGANELIVVVLGSTSSDARYTDTRNLFRWAWQQRLQAGQRGAGTK